MIVHFAEIGRGAIEERFDCMPVKTYSRPRRNAGRDIGRRLGQGAWLVRHQAISRTTAAGTRSAIWCGNGGLTALPRLSVGTIGLLAQQYSDILGKCPYGKGLFEHRKIGVNLLRTALLSFLLSAIRPGDPNELVVIGGSRR